MTASELCRRANLHRGKQHYYDSAMAIKRRQANPFLAWSAFEYDIHPKAPAKKTNEQKIREKE